MVASFATQISIERPPETVFALATDFTRLPEWMTAVEQLEPLDEGSMRKGWRFKETRSIKGREVSAEIEVIEHHGPEQGAPPYLHAARSGLMGIEGVYRISFADAGSGRTQVELKVEVRATSFLAKPMVGMALKTMKVQDGNMLEALKRFCESES